MPNSNIAMIKKLQRAINNKGYAITYNTSQFYSNEQDRPVTMYSIKKVVYNEKIDRNKYVEIFKSTSMIQIVLCLRDIWYMINGIELPTDNEDWNCIRKTIPALNSLANN